MADKDIKINIVTETDLSKLDELDERITALEEKANLSVEVDSSSIDEATEKSDELEESLTNVDESNPSPDVDDSSIEEAKEKTEELDEELDNVDNKSVSPEVDTSNIDNAKESLEGTASSMDSITTAATGLAATAGIEQMVATADRVNTSWNQLELTFASTGVSMDTLKSKSSELSSATGRSGSQVRDYFNQMGIAGITNVDLLSSSFENMAGRAYQTGSSIESMEGSVQRMVMSGNAGAKMLSNLGISSTELANAMGVTSDKAAETFKNLSETERLEVLSKAMGDGAKANEMYKNSYAGLKSQVDIAMGGLRNAVGQAILPVVIPAVKAAADVIKRLTDGFKNLPAPVQGIIGAIGGFAAIITAGIGVLGILGNVITTVRTGLTALRTITILNTIVTKASAAAQWLLNAAMNANPISILIIAITALILLLGYLYFNNEQVKAAIDGLAQTMKQVADVIWNSIGAAIQWLSDQFNSFTESLGLNSGSWTDAILGFLAFIPTLPLRVGQFLVDTIARALGFGDNFTQTMIDAATNAVTGFIDQVMQLPGMVMETLQGMWDYASTLGGLLPEQASITGNSIIDTVLNVLMTIANIPAAIAIYLTDSIASALGFGDNFAQTMMSAAMRGVTGFLTWLVTLPVSIGASLMSTLSQAINFGANFASNLLNAGRNAVNNLVNQIAQAPAMIQAEFNRILSIVSDFVTSLPQRVWDLGASIVGALKSALGIGSPGHMYWMFYGELERLEDAPITMRRNITDNVNRLGTAMVDSFNPELSGMSFANGSVVNGAGNAGGITVNFYDTVVDDDKRMQRIVDYITRELNFDNATAGRWSDI